MIFSFFFGNMQEKKTGIPEDCAEPVEGVGKLEGWKDGKLEDWKDGRLEGWKIGRLAVLPPFPPFPLSAVPIRRWQCETDHCSVLLASSLAT
jgi:hypothetical protein